MYCEEKDNEALRARRTDGSGFGQASIRDEYSANLKFVANILTEPLSRAARQSTSASRIRVGADTSGASMLLPARAVGVRIVHTAANHGVDVVVLFPKCWLSCSGLPDVCKRC